MTQEQAAEKRFPLVPRSRNRSGKTKISPPEETTALEVPWSRWLPGRLDDGRFPVSAALQAPKLLPEKTV